MKTREHENARFGSFLTFWNEKLVADEEILPIEEESEHGGHSGGRASGAPLRWSLGPKQRRRASWGRGGPNEPDVCDEVKGAHPGEAGEVQVRSTNQVLCHLTRQWAREAPWFDQSMHLSLITCWRFGQHTWTPCIRSLFCYMVNKGQQLNVLSSVRCALVHSDSKDLSILSVFMYMHKGNGNLWIRA